MQLEAIKIQSRHTVSSKSLIHWFEKTLWFHLGNQLGDTVLCHGKTLRMSEVWPSIPVARLSSQGWCGTGNKFYNWSPSLWEVPAATFKVTCFEIVSRGILSWLHILMIWSRRLVDWVATCLRPWSFWRGASRFRSPRGSNSHNPSRARRSKSWLFSSLS